MNTEAEYYDHESDVPIVRELIESFLSDTQTGIRYRLAPQTLIEVNLEPWVADFIRLSAGSINKSYVQDKVWMDWLKSDSLVMKFTWNDEIATSLSAVFMMYPHHPLVGVAIEWFSSKSKQVNLENENDQ